MSGSWAATEFPNLNSDNCEITSPATRKYNCLAWAAKEKTRRWEPDPQGNYYWPPGVPRELTMDAFVKAYETLGFSLCFSNALEQGVEKIALFGVERNGIKIPTHAALQIDSGKWTSKLGDLEDIRHITPDDVNGPIYGRPLLYLQRSIPSTNI